MLPRPLPCLHLAALYAPDMTDPRVAWLVYRGEMVSSPEVDERALSSRLTRYLQAATSAAGLSTIFRQELTHERIRPQQQPAAVSRLGGYCLFEDEPRPGGAPGS